VADTIPKLGTINCLNKGNKISDTKVLIIILGGDVSISIARGITLRTNGVAQIVLIPACGCYDFSFSVADTEFKPGKAIFHVAREARTRLT